MIPASNDLRVRFPLWVKLGVLFGGVYGAVVAAYGAWDWRTLVLEEQQRRQSELETVAHVVAAGIDADAHALFRFETDRALPAFRETSEALKHAIDRSGVVTWAGTCTRDDHGHWRYVVDGSSNGQPFPVGYPIFDGVRERDLAFEGRTRFVPGLEDESGRWDTVLAPLRGSDGAVVGLVEIVSDADRDSLVLGGLFRSTVLQLATAVLGGLLLSFVFGRLLARNLEKLVAAARGVAEGQLDQRVDIRTTDEIGVLAATFNRMIDGLKEREFIRDTFGRFVNKDVVAQILEDRSRLRLGGESRVVTVLMSDLRGFTALSDELGPERMVALLNRYLARMTAVVERYDGNVAELLGDGMVVLFGAPVAHADDARRAVACAVAMHRELAAFNAEEGGRRLQMGIGVDTGVVVAGNIGDERHMKYGVVGAAINVAARLESFTLGNQILVTEATRAAAGDVQVEDPIEFRAKGRREPLRAWPVRAAGDLRMPDDQLGVSVDVDLPGRVWRVEDKQVDATAHDITIVRLEPDAVAIRGEVRLRERDRLKLSFPLDEAVLDDLYGTVEAVAEGRAVVRLTSVPSDARVHLDTWLSERAGEATGPALQ